MGVGDIEMTMRDYCQSCVKRNVCQYGDDIIEFVDDVNKSFEVEFATSYIQDMVSIDFRCREYLKHVEQRNPGINA